jgi:hypothetical protein
MSQQFTQQFKTRLALLVFIKGAAAPMVLYFEDAKAEYDEFMAAMQLPVGKIIEKEPVGPIKKVAVMSNQIGAVALQEELYQQ